MNADALLVFAREPVPGRVKTRLAKDIGAESACQVYQELLGRTLNAARGVQAARFLYLPEGDRLDAGRDGFALRRQIGDDLGIRMQGAFDECFSDGFQRVVLVGSDCPTLTAPVMQRAFQSLENNPVVLGPARDGGYYLIGQVPPGRDLFSGIPWSSPDVWRMTRARIEESDIGYSTLKVLEDIDDLDSLRRYMVETGETLGVSLK